MVKLRKIWVSMKPANDIVSNKCFHQQFSLPGFSAILPMNAHSTGCGRCARSLCGSLPKCWLVPRLQVYSGLSSPNYFPIPGAQKKSPQKIPAGFFLCAKRLHIRHWHYSTAPAPKAPKSKSSEKRSVLSSGLRWLVVGTKYEKFSPKTLYFSPSPTVKKCRSPLVRLSVK